MTEHEKLIKLLTDKTYREETFKKQEAAEIKHLKNIHPRLEQVFLNSIEKLQATEMELGKEKEKNAKLKSTIKKTKKRMRFNRMITALMAAGIIVGISHSMYKDFELSHEFNKGSMDKVGVLWDDDNRTLLSQETPGTAARGLNNEYYYHADPMADLILNNLHKKLDYSTEAFMVEIGEAFHSYLKNGKYGNEDSYQNAIDHTNWLIAALKRKSQLASTLPTDFEVYLNSVGVYAHEYERPARDGDISPLHPNFDILDDIANHFGELEDNHEKNMEGGMTRG